MVVLLFTSPEGDFRVCYGNTGNPVVRHVIDMDGIGNGKQALRHMSKAIAFYSNKLNATFQSMEVVLN